MHDVTLLGALKCNDRRTAEVYMALERNTLVKNLFCFDVVACSLHFAYKAIGYGKDRLATLLVHLWLDRGLKKKAGQTPICKLKSQCVVHLSTV